MASARPRKAATAFNPRTICFVLLLLRPGSLGQSSLYPHNAASCERCHSLPTEFGASSMTVRRDGLSLEGKFIPASEGGIHHRSGESAQNSAFANEISGERVSLNLLGDGYIEAIDSHEIEQNVQQQSQVNLGIAGVVVSAPVLETSGPPLRCG